MRGRPNAPVASATTSGTPTPAAITPAGARRLQRSAERARGTRSAAALAPLPVISIPLPTVQRRAVHCPLPKATGGAPQLFRGERTRVARALIRCEGAPSMGRRAAAELAQ